MEFLERFYNEGIMPSEDNSRSTNKEYGELERKSAVLLKELEKDLSSEQKDLLSRLIETKLHSQSFEMTTFFANGFRLGGRLIAEIFNDKE